MKLLKLLRLQHVLTDLRDTHTHTHTYAHSTILTDHLSMIGECVEIIVYRLYSGHWQTHLR